MKRCQTCERPLTNLMDSTCRACIASTLEADKAYQRQQAPQVAPLITISEEQLRAMRNGNRGEARDTARELKALKTLRAQIDATDQGWKFLWIESARRRATNRVRTDIDAKIAEDEAELVRLRRVRDSIDRQIRKLSAGR